MNEIETTHQTEDRDINSVWFISGAQPVAKGMLELHSGAAGGMLKRNLRDVQEEVNIINQQVVLIIQSAEAQHADTGFRLDEFSVAVGVSAKGQLALLAEAGVTATFTLTFRRK